MNAKRKDKRKKKRKISETKGRTKENAEGKKEC